MKMYTRYGDDEVPQLCESDGRSSCPVCEKKHKKGAKVIFIAFNSGPTGRVFYCLKHAKQLAEEILQKIPVAP